MMPLSSIDRNSTRVANISNLLSSFAAMNTTTCGESKEEDILFACCAATKSIQKGLPVADLDAPDKRGKTPLQYASFMGHEECLKALLSAGANPNAQNATGMTPLHFAAASVFRDKRVKSCMAELSQNGADPMIPN